MGISKGYLQQHISHLKEGDKPLWGIMSPQHMIEHLIYVFRMSIGEVKQAVVTPEEKIERYQQSLYGERRLPKFFKSPYLKKEALEDLEFRSLEEAKLALLSYVDIYEKYYSTNPEDKNDHVIYGSCNKEKWDIIHIKHLDHHLRQFDLKKFNPDGYVERWISKEGIGTIKFHHPDHNSLPSNLLASIVDALNSYSAHPKCQAILLKSGGDRTFCAGASLKELVRISNKEEGLKFFSGFANVINAIRKNKKLVVGRVQGKAVGGGVGIASAVDICFASKYASIKLSELNIGIGPFVIAPAVERKVGKAAAIQLTLNPENFYKSDWAFEKGMYSEICDDNEALDKFINEYLQQIISYSPAARTSLKKMFWEGTDDWDELLQERAELSGTLVLSEETKAILAKYA